MSEHPKRWVEFVWLPVFIHSYEKPDKDDLTEADKKAIRKLISMLDQEA